MFSILFWQNILIKLQHVIKINQSWRFKSVLITEMTRCLLKWHEVTKQILSLYMKPNYTSYRVFAVCIMTRSGFSGYGLVKHDSYKSKSLHWMRSKFIGSNRPCLKWEKAIFDIPSLAKDYIPCSPILSWIKYYFHKNPN
jgi:hypothetical protein